MMSHPERWENGSEFHWLEGERSPVEEAPWQAGGALYGSGRDAFRALLEHGQANRGWKRLWVPDYFCQEVVEAFLSTGISVAVYADGPQQSASPELPDAAKMSVGDVLLRVNFFGLRSLQPLGVPDGVEIIEDHTHDPWSEDAYGSAADWCVVSLRKTLPVPDGGALWSPRGYSLPLAHPVSPERHLASLEKLAAMMLKKLYLDGQSIEKDTFRHLSISGENHVACGEVSAMPPWTRALMNTFPLHAWRAQRSANHRALHTVLNEIALKGATLLLPQDEPRTCPFSGVLLFDNAQQRAFVYKGLIGARVYPAILWPLEKLVVEGISPEAVDWSRRMLSIHCDARYNTSELRKVACLIGQFCREWRP